MNRCRLALVGGLLIGYSGAVAGSPGLLDPDDLAALLTDLEASGGILTEAELATLVAPPAPPPFKQPFIRREYSPSLI